MQIVKIWISTYHYIKRDIMKRLKQIIFICFIDNVLLFYLLFTWNYTTSIVNIFVMYVIVSLVIIVTYIICGVVVILSIVKDINEDDEL